MKIRPAHHALLCYAEWCCDNRLPWPGMKRVAADLARNIHDLQAAMADLKAWGLLSARYQGIGQRVVLRLGDGRETAPHGLVRFPQETDVIRLIHSRLKPEYAWPEAKKTESIAA